MATKVKKQQQQQQQLQQQQQQLQQLPLQPIVDVANDELFSLKTSELLWMRDKFISGLSNLESGVHELRRAYISHFNTLLPESHPGRLSLPFFTSFDNATAGPLGPRPETPVVGTEANVKKKRKPHDPNAPKRALTSYFLFMQHNKPQIKEANPAWDAKQVAEESERRWNNISEAEKQKYEYMYQVDLARYYKQKEAYEAGEPVPEINSDEATRLYNEHLKSGVPFKGRKGRKLQEVPAPNELPTIHANAATSDSSDDDSSEDEAPPPPKAKRQKKEDKPSKAAVPAAKMKATPIAPAAVPVPVHPTPVPSEKKKAGRKSKGADETAGDDKSAKKSRKRKSGAE